jgi:hypothetical protein
LRYSSRPTRHERDEGRSSGRVGRSVGATEKHAREFCEMWCGHRLCDPAHAHRARLRNEGATGNLMWYLRLVLIAGVLFGACSCSEVAGDLSISKPEQIRCQAGHDCDLKWDRAYKWVVENSGLKLKTKTDGLIKTEAGEDRTLVVTITKNPTSQSGTYEIDFIGKCPSILSCVPSGAESRTRFANFVLATD